MKDWPNSQLESKVTSSLVVENPVRKANGPMEVRAIAEKDSSIREAFIQSKEKNDSFKFPDNSIATYKYTLLSYVPLSLFEQCVKIHRCFVGVPASPPRLPWLNLTPPPKFSSHSNDLGFVA